MHITAVFASSVNGKITKGLAADPRDWTSEEDKQEFTKLRDTANLFIMGRNTYEVFKDVQKLSPDRLRIVLTTETEKYQEETIPGQLEFMNGNPGEIVKALEERGFTDALLLGGAIIFRDFLAAGLVSELSLTVEPKIFGQGKSLVEEGDFATEFKLISSTKLNDQGTLLLRYEVI
jgi:dihydrofolate reductase